MTGTPSQIEIKRDGLTALDIKRIKNRIKQDLLNASNLAARDISGGSSLEERESMNHSKIEKEGLRSVSKNKGRFQSMKSLVKGEDDLSPRMNDFIDQNRDTLKEILFT